MTTREVLAIRDFRFLWGAQVVSFFGDALTTMGLLFLVQRAVGGTAAVAGVLIANALPFLLVGLVAGVWVDRLDRKAVMIWSDVIRAGLVLLIPVVGADRLWLLYVLVFIHASVGTFFAPARTALIPRIVPSAGLPAANGLAEATRPVALVLGTATAGLLVGVFDGFVAVFTLDALTFLVSAVFVGRVATSGRSATPTTAGIRAVAAELGAGFATVARNRILLGVLVGGAVAMFGLGATNALAVPFVIGELGLAETWFGLIEGAQTVGLVVAGSSLGWLSRRLGLQRIVSLALAAVGVLVALLSQVTGLPGLVVLFLAIGLGVAPLTGSVSTLLQRETPPELLGRVAASLNATVTGASVGSMAVAATLAGLVGVRGVFVVSGLVALVASAASALLFRGTAPAAAAEAATP
ncbi:MAG: MFS transporter [Acidimicrobiia bacterium]